MFFAWIWRTTYVSYFCLVRQAKSSNFDCILSAIKLPLVTGKFLDSLFSVAYLFITDHFDEFHCRGVRVANLSTINSSQFQNPHLLKYRENNVLEGALEHEQMNGKSARN